jgi:crossover junction endodeoxyribonuclease RusA
MIELPFPSSKLAGHSKGTHWATSREVATHRSWAFHATREAKLPKMPAVGDIAVEVHFYPADKRGDRVNFPNRMKPYFDGVAEALGVNDSRFLPSYHFYAPCKPGYVFLKVTPL